MIPLVTLVIETHGALAADYLASIKERQMSREPIFPLGGATQRVEVGLGWTCIEHNNMMT